MNRRLGKVYTAIKSLPDTPTRPIYWIVYNSDMVEYTTRMIASIKGEDYLQYIKVVAKSEPTNKRINGSIYFDPGLYDLLGNGLM